MSLNYNWLRYKWTWTWKEVIDVLNAIVNRYKYIYQLISNVQFPGSKTFDSQILMYSCTPKNDFSLAKEFQKHMSKEHHKHGVIGQGKYRKISTKRKWINREYHVQDNSDVAHKNVKMCCDIQKFQALPFFGSHPKPHRARGLSKHYNLHFYPKQGRGICAIFRIPCASVGCTSIL